LFVALSNRAFFPSLDELTYLDAARFLFGCLAGKKLKAKKARAGKISRPALFFACGAIFTDS
jgi:hypothetical protein